MGQTRANRVEKELRALSDRFSLLAIYVFGSRAKEIAGRILGKPAEMPHPDSDVDIGVLPQRGHRLSAKDKAGLAVALEDILDAERVDLVVLPEVGPYLALDVVCGELLFTADPDAEAEYQLYVMSVAGDLGFWELERRRMILGEETVP